MSRTSADWIQDGVIYEINTRAFSPAGNFQGIIDRLDDLQRLGATILWLMPIHPNGQLRKKGTLGSPYAVRDYYAIEPSFGTPEDFRRLVQETHNRHMKIIIDVVANHTAWDSVMMDRPGFYSQDGQGNIIPPNPDWVDVAHLNYSNPDLRRYMTTMLQHWLTEYDLDGFRCDVAGLVPTSWWDETRDALDQVKSDIVMLAEWHSPDLMQKAFDIDYSWPLHKSLTEVLQSATPASELQKEWEEEKNIYPAGALHLRFSDNHDEKRAIARFGERGALAASAFMFLLDGVPLIYNGMEVGDTAESGAPALFERMPIFWQIAERRPEFPRFYKEIVPLRHKHEALRRGSLEWTGNSDRQRILTFFRRGQSEQMFVAINFSNQPWTGEVEGAFPGEWQEITLTGFSRELNPRPLPAVGLDAWGVRIFRQQQ